MIKEIYTPINDYFGKDESYDYCYPGPHWYCLA